MKISVTYAHQAWQLWLKLEVEEGTTVGEAIEQSGILQRVPEIDLENQKVGIFGKAAKLDKVVSEGERIEIYRPITAVVE